jgi:ectoine hydroxylase-related dioxygenase (phytanoyl-CoA dioxygenase family)|tara:strand:- start:762 stop:1541 length:780 start_codon:yes stop_codon:yes gene_type:complete
MSNALKKKYDKNGYAIIRDVIDPELVSEVEDHVHWLSKKYPDTRPEAFHHSLLVHDPFIHHLLDNKNLLDIIEAIIGPDIALFGAHYIAKKPYDGKPVGWHQDGSYWPLEPMEVVSVWLAGTDSTTENACMRVIPGTQNKKMLKPSEMINLDTEEYVLDLAIRPGDIDDADAVDIELKAGDISIHNPSIVHGSNSNVSDKWRIGLTLRYIPTSTYVNREGWDCILLRGKPTSWIKNNYTKKPVFDPSEHMPFSGQGVYR